VLCTSPGIERLKYNVFDWLKEELIEIRSDSSMKMEFNETELADFWIRQQHPSTTKAAFAIMIPRVSTYICETVF
jgi:D-mannonate dehydratase